MAFEPKVTLAAGVELIRPPRPTEGPRRPPPELLRRDATVDLVGPDNTCGFISGLAGAAYHCGNSAKCAFIPGKATPGVVACCNTDTCGARLTCIDKQQFLASSCDNGCAKDTFTLKCTAASAPYCNGVSFVDVNARDYFCDSVTVSTWQTAFTTYVGENDGRSFSPLTIQSTTSKPSTTAATTDTGALPGLETTTTSASSSTTTVPPPGGSSTPVAAIAGGVVGGVGGIALIALAIFLIVRRNDKKKRSAAVPAPEVAPSYDPSHGHNPPVYGIDATHKPTPAVQEQPLNTQWTPVPAEGKYGPPEIYPAPYQHVDHQQYPPMAEMQGNTYHPQQSGFPHSTGYHVAGQQMPAQTYGSPASPGLASQHSGHLSAAYTGSDGPSPVPWSAPELRGSETASRDRDLSPMHSPTPTHTTVGVAGSPAGATPAAINSYASPEGRAEMSANMAGPLHRGAYEMPGGADPQGQRHSQA